MKIVFLTSSYYPYFSAIGKCIYNLANELKQENEIIVISNMTTNNLTNEVEFEGHKIIRVRTESMIYRDRILAQNESFNQFAILSNKIKLLLLRMVGYFKVNISKETIQKPLVKEYFKALSNVGDVDLIIPTCYPFEAIVAAQEYKNKTNSDVQIIPFLFDKFSDSPTLHRNQLNKKIKYKNHLSLEEQMIKDSTQVLYVDSWIHKMNNYFSDYDEKLIHVEHPLIIDHFSRLSFGNEINNNEYIDITYTGVIDKKVRPPYETLKIISKMIEKNNKLRFHFYVLGNGIDEINYYNKKYLNNIFNHGQVESNIALSKIMQSSILLSIGNTDTTLIPSKIFEYMSSGKPIIHFFHSEDDRVISMLKDYELAYCINQNEEITDLEISKLVEFCNDNKINKKSFEEVQKIFYKADPKFISNIIQNGQKKFDE
jgi:hypothetical protein